MGREVPAIPVPVMDAGAAQGEGVATLEMLHEGVDEKGNEGFHQRGGVSW